MGQCGTVTRFNTQDFACFQMPLSGVRAPASKPGECLRAGIPARWMVVRFCASLRETTSVKDFTVVDRVIKNCSTNLWSSVSLFIGAPLG